MSEIRNAKIIGTTLGFEDHGVMTAFIQTISDATGQSFGGYCMEGQWAIEFIKAVLKALEVDAWENLPGTHCRLDADHDKIHRIGHIIKNHWFDPKNDLKKYERETK